MCRNQQQYFFPKHLLNQSFIVPINSCNLVTFLWSLRTNWYMVNTIWETLTIYLSLYILSSDSHESISFYFCKIIKNIGWTRWALGTGWIIDGVSHSITCMEISQTSSNTRRWISQSRSKSFTLYLRKII